MDHTSTQQFPNRAILLVEATSDNTLDFTLRVLEGR